MCGVTVPRMACFIMRYGRPVSIAGHPVRRAWHVAVRVDVDVVVAHAYSRFAESLSQRMPALCLWM